MKKLCLAFLCLLLVMALLPLAAAPARAESDGNWTYYVSGDKATVTKYTGSGGNVTIPSTLGGKPVTEIGKSAFSGCTGLTAVTIPASVTSIGNSAFSGCTGLTSVTIPRSVTSIGNGAFTRCTGLTYLTIPEGVTCIDNAAFYDCTNLTNVTIPKSVTKIGSWAFENCKNLRQVIISDLKAWCSIEFGNRFANPLYYAHHLYLQETEITVLNIPSGLTSIGDYAFFGLSSMTKTSVPATVTDIGDFAFCGCGSLIEINVASDNPSYCSESGVLFNKAKTSLITYPGGKPGSYTIPGSVNNICSYAFYECSYLTGVVIPSSVTSISEYAFARCNGLTNMVIPNSVTNIGSYTFSDCRNLSKVTIPDSITSIEWGTFYQCEKLNDVILSNNVVRICEYAFYGCSSLTDLTIPNSVTLISSWAFENCSSIVNITIPDSVTTIGFSAFSGCCGLTSLMIPSSLTRIDDLAFSGCSGLTKVSIPSSITSIGVGTFADCSNLTDVFYDSDSATWASIVIGDYNEPLNSASIHYNSTGPLSVTGITANRSSAKPGEPLTWSASASGGTGSLQYCFYIFKDGKIIERGSYGSTKTYSYKAEAPGTYTARVYVKDSAGTIANLTGGSVTVAAADPLVLNGVSANQTSAKPGRPSPGPSAPPAAPPSNTASISSKTARSWSGAATARRRPSAIRRTIPAPTPSGSTPRTAPRQPCRPTAGIPSSPPPWY